MHGDTPVRVRSAIESLVLVVARSVLAWSAGARRAQSAAQDGSAQTPLANGRSSRPARGRRGDPRARRCGDGGRAPMPADFRVALAERLPQGAAGHVRSVHAGRRRARLRCRGGAGLRRAVAQARERRAPADDRPRQPARPAGGRGPRSTYPVDAIFPVELTPAAAVRRGSAAGFRSRRASTTSTWSCASGGRRPRRGRGPGRRSCAAADRARTSGRTS